MLFYGNRGPCIFAIKVNKMKPNSTQSSQLSLQLSSGQSPYSHPVPYFRARRWRELYIKLIPDHLSSIFKNKFLLLFSPQVVYLHFNYNYLHVQLLSWQLLLNEWGIMISYILGNFQGTYKWFIQHRNLTNFLTSPFQSPLFPLFTNCLLTMILSWKLSSAWTSLPLIS